MSRARPGGGCERPRDGEQRSSAAKPTIDIQISVADLDHESSYVAQIERAGAQLHGRDALHRFFRPFAGQPRDVHVHVCQGGSDWEREHLLFRDYLRSNAAARDAYVKVKWEAAQVWSDDRIAYTEAKTGVILDLLDAAETWATANSWAVNRRCTEPDRPDLYGRGESRSEGLMGDR